jgi:hypothetical protein
MLEIRYVYIFAGTIEVLHAQFQAIPHPRNTKLRFVPDLLRKVFQSQSDKRNLLPHSQLDHTETSQPLSVRNLHQEYLPTR